MLPKMKFTTMMKDPDGFQDSLKDAVVEHVAAIDGLLEHEAEELVESRFEEVADWLDNWFDCREYVHIDVDTEAGTVTLRRE